ncbi:MAG: arylesterase [Alphaproteobacteria bacterium]|nr:arylesterase [Alphaproteobacteria bacterium]
MLVHFRRIRSHTTCTYGRSIRIINGVIFRMVRRAVLDFAAFLAISSAGVAADETVIVAFGDSLSAGYGLEEVDSFPLQLERALVAHGLNARVINAGVSGDTTAGGRARLAWSMPPDANLVILELGANDGLRGIDPAETEANLDAMLRELGTRDTKVLFTGMRAPPNLGREYGDSFNGMYARLAQKHNVALYPFFLEGVAAEAELNQADGIHPNAAGVARIVDRITPYVLEELGRLGPSSSK